jgi:acyl-CoA dehydrogenase
VWESVEWSFSAAGEGCSLRTGLIFQAEQGPAVDFSISAEIQDLCRRMRRFVDEQVIPREKEANEDGLPPASLAQVREMARREGLWAPHLPAELGGLGLSLPDLAPVFEEAGRSLLGPLAINGAPPDEGNMHLLHLAGTPAQKQKYLEPLARGACRSCFAMTEPPPGAGSDPTMLLTRAERREGRWILNGHKWFTSGAEGARFAIVAAVSDPSAPARHNATLFLVELPHPGFQIVRRIPTMTGGAGGHCEILLRDCAVGDEAVLGPVNGGFALMQARLGPARLTHCMRWVGAARRCLEVARDHALKRSAFGKTLAEHEGLQWLLADSATDLHACRLMIAQAAWKLAQNDQARVETSMCKVFVAEAVGRVVDRALQICGGQGVAADLPLERIYREVRAFRIYDGPSEVHRMVIAREFLRPRV